MTFVDFQALDMICCWIDDPNSDTLKLHLARIYDYLWVAEDGMKVQVDIMSCLVYYLYSTPLVYGSEVPRNIMCKVL